MRKSAYTTLYGTMEYYPPEYRIKGKYHAKSAMSWSLGVILFTMLCGRFPTGEDLQKTELNLWSEPGLSEDLHICLGEPQMLSESPLSFAISHPSEKPQRLASPDESGRLTRSTCHGQSSSQSSIALVPQWILSWLTTSQNFDMPEVPAMLLQTTQFQYSRLHQYKRSQKVPAMNIPKVPAMAGVPSDVYFPQAPVMPVPVPELLVLVALEP
ncbi:hypothetical protein Q8A67_009360 [Cirrhinus molitorella]|uniref:non-specific serine/threonine protein kinase n=1 Tax=Cirrhinus molitorella TaxID=172907 RepID=A0AA88Q0L3_9TELE|nr:hypothetical protein Q8A67_009360 [Cirrhinus molitorella]